MMAFFRKSWIFLLLSLTLIGISGCREEPLGRPNLLFILADDLTERDLACFGSPNALSPHIDKLASEGMRFENCFSAVAMCAPLRMQLYTGLHPVRSGAWPNHSKVKPEVKSIVHYLEPLGYRVGLSGKTHINPAENFPFDEVKPALQKQAYLEYMSSGENPFALFICSHEPHFPWNKGDSAHFDPDQLQLYADQVDSPEFRRALCRYYAEIEFLDRQVGEALAALKESGKEENTIVLFATEQGAQIPGAKWTLYDAGIKAGMIVKWPGKVEAGSQSKALVNYIDILPTFLDIIGADQSGLDGHSFLDVLLQKKNEHDAYVYGIHTQKGAIGSPEQGYPIRSIRDKHYALIKNLRNEQVFSNALTSRDGEKYWYSWLRQSTKDSASLELVERYLNRPPIEFYDIQKDPMQLNNLANKAEYAHMITQMERELQKWMDRQGDQGLETEDLAYTRDFRYK